MVVCEFSTDGETWKKLNNEKVYIEGYVVGFVEDTTGIREKQIQVSS